MKMVQCYSLFFISPHLLHRTLKAEKRRLFFRFLKVGQHLDQQISGADEGTRLRHGRLSATCITGCVYKRRTTIGMLYGMLSTSVRPYPRLNRAIGREGRHTNKRLDRSRGSLLKWGSPYGDLGFAIILNIG